MLNLDSITESFVSLKIPQEKEKFLETTYNKLVMMFSGKLKFSS